MVTVERIDRVTKRGDIREHLRNPGAAVALCGLRLDTGSGLQPACGNRPCFRCRARARYKGDTIKEPA